MWGLFFLGGGPHGLEDSSAGTHSFPGFVCSVLCPLGCRCQNQSRMLGVLAWPCSRRAGMHTRWFGCGSLRLRWCLKWHGEGKVLVPAWALPSAHVKAFSFFQLRDMPQSCSPARGWGRRGDQGVGEGGTGTLIQHSLLAAPSHPPCSVCPRWTSPGLGDSPLPPVSVGREGGRL